MRLNPLLERRSESWNYYVDMSLSLTFEVPREITGGFLAERSINGSLGFSFRQFERAFEQTVELVAIGYNITLIWRHSMSLCVTWPIKHVHNCWISYARQVNAVPPGCSYCSLTQLNEMTLPAYWEPKAPICTSCRQGSLTTSGTRWIFEALPAHLILGIEENFIE